MKSNPLKGLVEAGVYKVKRNAWYTMYINGQCPYLSKAPAEDITAKVPRWAHAREGPKARPEGVKAVNDISEYVWLKLGEMGHIHPGYRAALTMKIWSRIDAALESGQTVTPDMLDGCINAALEELASELGVDTSFILRSGNKKYEMLEERKKRIRPLLASDNESLKSRIKELKAARERRLKAVESTV